MTFEKICQELQWAVQTSGIPRMRSRFRTSDVVQECGIQIWKKIQSQGKPANEINSSYIRKVAIGHLCELHRFNLAAKRSVKREVANTAVDQVGTCYTPDNSNSKHEQAFAMLDSLRVLPPNQKDIVIRRFFEEQSFEAIAASLDLTIYRVRKLYESSLVTLRESVEAHES